MQRNGQNPIRASFKQERGKFINPASSQSKTKGMLHCPACNAEVPPKPGFRPSSLKCPKCGAAMHK